MRFKKTIQAHVAESVVNDGRACDICHDNLAKDSQGYLASAVELGATIGEVYPETDCRTAYETDVCARCFEEKVVPALAQIGLVFRERRADGEDGDGRVFKAQTQPSAAPMGLARFRELYKGEDGFLAFCKELKIRPEDSTTPVPFVLNAIQADYCAKRTKRDLVVHPRRSGLTTIELARDLWFFLLGREVNVLVVCPSSPDHMVLNEIETAINLMISALRENVGLGSSVQTEDATWIVVSGNGASKLTIVEAAPSARAATKRCRANTIHRLHSVDRAFWEHAGATLEAILPSVPPSRAGTEVVHESGPNGSGGAERPARATARGGPLFYWCCQDAVDRKSDFQFVFISWLSVPEYALELEPDPATGLPEALAPQTARENAVVARGGTLEQLKWYREQVLQLGQDQTDQAYPLDSESCWGAQPVTPAT